MIGMFSIVILMVVGGRILQFLLIPVLDVFHTILANF